jgi:hypothetical protein
VAKRDNHRPARALTAASTIIDPSTRFDGIVSRRRPLPWQRQAFEYYDVLGELRFALNWKASAISRLRLVPSLDDTDNGVPIDLSKTEPLDKKVISASTEILARLEAGEGGSSEIMKQLSLNLSIAGEAYLVARPIEDDKEDWSVESVLAVVVNQSGKLAIRPFPDARISELVPLDDDSFVLRIMTRHPAYREMPDCALRSALETCEDLRLLTNSIRATASSRMASGALFIPEEASFGSPDPTTDEGDGMETEDALTRDLILHFTTPVSDSKSAAAVVPFLIRMSREDIAAVRFERFDREIDKLSVQLRDEARSSLAAAVDLPAEVITGIGDVNHWTAWQITEDAFRLHIEPAAISMLDALTTGYYRPALEQMGIPDAHRYRLWYDNSELVSHPDSAARVLDAYDRVEVSGEYLRSTFTIPDEAAPDDAELKHRAELVAILAGPQPQPAAPEPDGDEVDTSTAKAAPPSDKKKPSAKGADAKNVKGKSKAADVAQEGKKNKKKKAITASGLPDYNEMSLRLAQIDRTLRQKLQIAADAELSHVLDKAGNRLRSYAQRDKTKMASNLVANVPSNLVAATLGKGMVTQFAVTTEDLLAGGFLTLEQRYKLMVKQSQKEMRREMREYELLLREEELEAKQEEDRNNGWLWFAAALTALAAVRLYEPTSPQPIDGEFEEILVPAGTVRGSLRVAGGGSVDTDPTAVGSQQAADGISGLTSGQTAEGVLTDNGLKFGNGYVWVYGSEETRIKPFDPHFDLDLFEFSNWNDEALVNNNAWPDFEFYFPGDHQYCQCDAARIIEGEISDESAIFDEDVSEESLSAYDEGV